MKCRSSITNCQMKLLLTLTSFLLAHILFAQKKNGSVEALKFDFGFGSPKSVFADKLARGYTPVTSSSFYMDETGFGFDSGNVVAGVNRRGNDFLKDDFITSDKPFFFSV